MKLAIVVGHNSVAGAVPADWSASVIASHGYAFEPEPEI